MLIRKSSVIFGVVVISLLIVCVGLLIALLHNQSSKTLKSEEEKLKTTSSITSKSTITSSTSVTPTVIPEDDDYRLPSSVSPLHYDVILEPMLDHAIFKGKVTILVKATEEVDSFTVNVHKPRLTVVRSNVTIKGGKELDFTVDTSQLDREFFTLRLKEKTPPGEYLLHYVFHGNMSNANVGFYRSSYKSGGKTRYLATSKFQPTYARRAFPCFDEPNFKSTFNVTLVHNKDMTALSNMPVLNTTVNFHSGLTETNFENSVPMVTYLACFIICDFKYSESKTPTNNIPFRVYATPDQVNKTAFALDTGVKILEFYEKYFGIPYPLPKQDMIAIPDFQSGAMEHWGLITYRETNLLYDENDSSPQNMQRVATVVSHELAHMWFGNLVTMEWWDDLWLNEGFASYIEYKGVNEVFKEWNMMEQILTDDLQSVMRLDATTSSHPIIQPVKNPDQITEIFDAISYNKGAVVLRMLESVVNEKNFKDGISKFLKKYQYKNAKTENLWQEINEVYKERNVSDIMSTWTKQMGFPYVNVKKTAEGKFTVKQIRFLTHPNLKYIAEMYIWKIPLTFITSKGETGTIWLEDDKELNITIPISGTDDWVKFNHDQVGYYIVNYEDEEWERLSNVLLTNHQSLTPGDRSSLLFDAFMLAQAQIINYSVPLSMAKYLVNEMHLTPWETAYACLVQMGHLFQEPGLKTFLKDLTTPLYRKLGWKSHRVHVDSLLQTTIVGLACYSGNEDCMQEASNKLQAMMHNKSLEIPLSLRNILFHYAMEMSGSKEEWEYLWEKYNSEETSAQERIKLLYGMAHVKDEILIKQLLDNAMDPNKIRTQDFFTVLTYVAGNPNGRKIVWDFVRREWTQIVDRFTLNERYLGRAVKSICDYFNTEEQLKEMEEFFNRTEAGAGALAREQALENVKNNIYWMKSHKPTVDNWLKEDGEVPSAHFRLDGSAIPEHYTLKLQPHLLIEKFNGAVSIKVTMMNSTRYIILHSNMLTITKTQVLNQDGTKLEIKSTYSVPENEFWVTELKDKVSLGDVLTLNYEFQGNLSSKNLVGFYRSSYIDPEGERRYLATSQFQSTYARQAFPCFDEPQFKSNFTITLVHWDNYTAISNMPVSNSTYLGDGWTETEFQTSVKMVTYLVAVIVSDFNYTENSTKSGIKVRVYARPAEQNRTQYALNCGVKTLEFFEEYFGVPYPLPKLDMIAVPDFQAGAMENWGLVTYRETLLLFDELETSSYGQLRIDAVIGHELAHMWFGNLVTMKWWDDLWLNEGFASYMEYKSMEQINPLWEVDAQFFFEDTHRVLIPDASTSSHPIVQKVSHPDEISSIFDAISYSKGAAVLRMLENFLGPKTFREGVSAYLNHFKFGNAVTADLWKFLKQAAENNSDLQEVTDVAEVMDTWTLQMGYPYINVTKSGVKGGVTTYIVKPKRFLISNDGQTNDSAPFGYTWDIPLTFRTEENVNQTIHWIKRNETTTEEVKVSTTKWTKFNVLSTGYYIVNYGEEWDTITSLLQDDHEKLSPSDRANLISDVFLLARADLLPYERALKLTTYLEKESHFVPWETAKRSLAYLVKLLQYEPDTGKLLKDYLNRLTKKKLTSLGWEDKGDHLTRRLRATLVDIACESGNDECLKETGRILKEWKENNTMIPSNLRLLVYRYGMQDADSDTWDFMLGQYLTATSSQMQRDLLYGLAFTKNETIINKYIDLTNDSSIVRGQDYFTALGYIASNPVGLPLVWNYVRENWTLLVNKFGLIDRYLGNMVQSICNHFSTQERLDEMEKFFADYPDAGAGERSRQEALQTVRNAIVWLSKYKKPVDQWLKTGYSWLVVRLTRDVKPIHYDLKLHPDIEKGNFTGKVQIQVQLTSIQRYLIVHSHRLEVTTARVTRGHENVGAEVEIVRHFHHAENQFLVVEVKEDLPPGQYTLHYEFSGTLLGSLVGFYRSSYTDAATNTTKYLATSQFQSTYARQAFPCMDEPSFKSTFTVTLVHEKNMVPLSNMPVVKTVQNANSLDETSFDKSVPMVTYLVCVIVCDFEYQTTLTNRNTELRVYAPPDRVHQVNFSLDIGKRVLEYFEDYFNIPYPLPKLDMIALPDFRAGAMENWGLITYRELYLLFDKKETSPNVQFSIAMIIAHEIAHMWFGNLVTMEWWDDLWLNEGFATHMAYKCISEIRTDMDAVGLFILGELSKVLEPDATWSSHPIVVEVNHPDEIQGIFDAISYSKGASVLRKLENFLSPEKFQKGLEEYLKSNAYKNAKTHQLWDELTKITDGKTNVTETMDTWTRQMGYPVVRVTRNPGKGVNFNQRRFLLNPDSKPVEDHTSPFNYEWIIPMHFKNINVSGIQWMRNTNETFEDLPDLGGLKKWNSDQAGYYVVNYEENDWTEWAKILKKNDSFLSNLDRSNLLSDAFLLATAGDLKYSLALDLTKYLEDIESDFLPWTTGKSGLIGVLQHLQAKESDVKLMQNYLVKLSKRIFDELKWDDDPDEPYLQRRLRATVADLACRAESTTCLDEAANKLEEYLLNNISIPSALRSLVYRYGIWKKPTLWDDLWSAYLVTPSAQEKRDLLYGLAFARNVTVLEKYLELAKVESNVRSQDFFSVLNNIAANPEGLNLAWDFYRKEWQFLVDRFTINDGSLGGAVRSITSHFATEDRLEEMKDFFREQPEAGAGKTDRKEALEMVENNIRWTKSYQETVRTWLEAVGP